MNIIKINIPTQNKDNMCIFRVLVYDNTNTWKNIFNGKVFVMSGSTSVSIDIEDILWNYRYTGSDFFEPTVNATGDNYVMKASVGSITKESLWYNAVKVEVLVGNTYYNAQKSGIFFTKSFVGNYSNILNGTIPLNMKYQPVSHIPSNAPSGFCYVQPVYTGTFNYKVDDNTYSKTATKLDYIKFTGGSRDYSLGDNVIAKIDSCNKPYYLVWLTETGAMQCQGFLKSSEFSVEYTYNDRTDMSDFNFNYNKVVRGKWKLKSQNLSDRDYNAYGEMFNSPYVILLDMENNILHYVNITDTTYNKKMNGVNNNKKIFFEINVKSSEIKNL